MPRVEVCRDEVHGLVGFKVGIGRGVDERWKVGNFPAQLVEEFLRALSVQGGMNLHAEVLYGRDVHHQIEAIFKALAKALEEAVRRDPRVKGVPSTKGRF